MLIQEICVLSLPEMLCKLTYIYNGYVLFLPVWLCCFIYDSLVLPVWFGQYGFSQYVFAGMVLVMSSLPRTLLHSNLSSKYPYFSSVFFVHAVFGVVGNFFFVFFYLYTYTIFFVGGGV